MDEPKAHSRFAERDGFQSDLRGSQAWETC